MLNAARKAADRRRRRHHQRRRVRPAGRVRRADRRAGHPDADGLGHDPRRPPADGRHVRPADRRTATATRRCSQPTSCSASAIAGPTATPARSTSTRKGRTFVHVDIEPTQIGRVFDPDLGIVSRRARRAGAVRRGGDASGRPRASCRIAARWVERMPGTQADDASQDALRPGADQAAARLRGDEQGVRPRDTSTSPPSACRRSPARSSCTSTSRATGSIAARPARSAGRCRQRSACVAADPTRNVVGAVGRLRLPVHDRGAGGRRAVQAALHPCRGEQLLSRPDPPGAARLRDGLLRAARLREHQRRRPDAARATASITQAVVRGWAARRCGWSSPKKFGAAPASRRKRWRANFAFRSSWR